MASRGIIWRLPYCLTAFVIYLGLYKVHDKSRRILTKNFLCGVRVRSAERKQKDLPVGRSFKYYNIFCFTSSAGFHDLFHHK